MSGTTVTLVGGGLCTIDANQAGNALYLPASQVQQSFTVAKANQTIAFGALGGRTFGDAPFAISATASSGLTVSFASTTTGVCTVAGTTVTLVAAGPCTIVASQPGTTDFNAAAPVPQSFTVAKAGQTVSFTSAAPSATVGGPTYTPTATATSGLGVTFALDGTSTGCTLGGGVVSFTSVGTCKINATQAGNANYDAAPPVQQSFAVAAAGDTTPPTITNIMNGRSPLSWTNNNNGSNSWNGGACAGNQLCATITDTGGSGVDPATISFSLVGFSGANAGKCYDTATAGFKAGPCTIMGTFNAGVARTVVDQSDMLDGTYTLVINAKDNAGNPATQQTVVLTIT
ncbi:hypothetical protein EFK50_16670 [Nocardioides marmoriginsengisoli]|uniref:MBG domain-containing protein n=1 Tax=Nocardioides marmoriginsengisoli TaxID=661483 RepID=A0A3N0CC49_9ACTN|nr:hypothetical protein [Nocardioides marmoriginsengisoli]RNL61020.1 hypothetical protein EFK50_16670 [Nocardioides marmoriginsengisoli]